MFSVEQYLEMARECLIAAESAVDPKERKAHLDLAKLYTNAAANLEVGIEAAMALPAKP